MEEAVLNLSVRKFSTAFSQNQKADSGFFNAWSVSGFILSHLQNILCSVLKPQSFRTQKNTSRFQEVFAGYKVSAFCF